MIEIIERKLCTGCGACMSSCPKSAISMQIDSEGFEFPIINANVCIDCGLCQKVCPPSHFLEREEKRNTENTVQRGFAARNKNFEERLISSSGSIFPVLAHYVIDKKGFVVGVAFDEEFNAIYRIVNNVNDLHYIQGSKYLQCKVDDSIFMKIRKALNEGMTVLFSGLACQIEGLRSYLGKDYENLFCVDLICMGIPSAMVWQMYLSTYFKKEKIISVNFKEKSVGWDRFNLSIETNKQTFKQWGMINPYFKSMFNTYNMRQSCFACQFKNIERSADITLADCWGANHFAKEFDDNKGLSSVIVHSKKGLKLWKAVSDKVDAKELPLDVIIAGNKNMIENRSCDEHGRMVFYQLLNSGKIRKAFRFAEMHGENVPISNCKKIMYKFKSIIKKIIV